MFTSALSHEKGGKDQYARARDREQTQQSRETENKVKYGKQQPTTLRELLGGTKKQEQRNTLGRVSSDTLAA